MMRLCALAILSVMLLSCAGGGPHVEQPRGPALPLVTFVFDDGDDTDYLVGKRIFAEQGAVACSAVTTDWINTRDHLTPAQILELRDAGWEIMSHTASHPNLPSLDENEIDADLGKSKTVLEGMGLKIKNIVYPFNKNDEKVRRIAAKYFRSGRGGTNTLNEGVSDPYYLKSFSLKHDVDLMKSHIDRAYARKSWLIFYGHEVDAQVKVSDKEGTFVSGETLVLSPSGTKARYVTVHWFPLFGFSLYLVPLSGVPQPGDVITGEASKATAHVDSVMYNDLILLSEMIGYIHRSYPDMRIVTIDQGLDLLGVPDRKQ